MAGMKLFLAFLLLSSPIAMIGQQAQETHVSGYWVDPSTKLMWAGQDNGADINWGKAMKYCHNLRLEGYTNWRLPTFDELDDLISNTWSPSPEARSSQSRPHAKPVREVTITGVHIWSSSRVPDDRGKPSGYAWLYNQAGVQHRDYDPTGYDHGKRALCVRQP
jgi:hypothetical protein